MTDSVTPIAETVEETIEISVSDASSATPETPTSAKAQRPTKPDVFPVLEKLATLYPQHFGAEFLPLKRGIFQDLMEAHPDTLDQAGLKAALAFHTRSTRYLTVVASGQQRHDLQGQPVEPMAPEHVQHALLEVFRRRQTRSKEDLRPKLLGRIVQAQEASGLSPLAYADLVRSRDEAANAVLDEAMLESQARDAKTEALLRAFEASGKSVEEFADMYGMEPRAVRRMLPRKPAAAA